MGTHENWQMEMGTQLPELVHTQRMFNSTYGSNVAYMNGNGPPAMNTMHPHPMNATNMTHMTNQTNSIEYGGEMGERSWEAFISDKERLLVEMGTANNFNNNNGSHGVKVPAMKVQSVAKVKKNGERRTLKDL